MQTSSSELRGMAKLTYKNIVFYSNLCKHGTHLTLHHCAWKLFLKITLLYL